MSATGDATGDGAAGFTLLETLTALALTALVSVIAFPLLGGALRTAALAEARAQVLGDLRAARGQAIRAGTPVAFQASADGRDYGWSGGPRRSLPALTRLEPAAAPVAFYPDGSASPGVLVVSAQARRTGVAVAPTGAVWAIAP
jgi:type II secretory pathway pseudopilin PulG